MSLEFRGITKTPGGEPHLYEMEASLSKGAVNVLLGPTLAGKTSLMRIMAGLDQPRTGRILVDGRDVTGLPIAKRSVAMVYQQFINYPSFTVYENIAAPLRRRSADKATLDRKVRDAAAKLRIEHLLDRLPAELSGGQQQRTALARALVKDAELLLLDEPLVNLDYKLREELRVELRHIFSEGRSTVVYATTEPQEALMLGGNILVLDQGRLLQTGATVDVYRKPATVRVGAVFSDPPINLVDGVVEGGQARLADTVALPLIGHLAGLAPGRYRFGIRAGHLFLAPGEGLHRLDAAVQLAEISGSETFIHIAAGPVTLVVQEEGVHGSRLGETISVYIDPLRLFVFDASDRLVAAPGDVSPPVAAQ